MGSLSELIQKGESKTIEFKEKITGNLNIAKTAVAFSNTAGGRLLIGVREDKEIIGVAEDIFKLQDRIVSVIYDSCYPIIRPEIYTTSIDDKVVMIVEFFKGSNLPYFIKSAGVDNGVFLRIGATNRKADHEMIRQLERERKNVSFDEEVNYEYEFSNLNLSKLEEKFKSMNKTLTDEKLQSLKLTKKANNKVLPTNGLLVLLGEPENVVTKCSRFKGNDMSVFIDKKEFAGDLFQQLEDCVNFVKNHINLNAEISGLQRNDRYEIPEVAIREAIVNAIVHRDYSNSGRDVKVAVYDDRIEVVSPGPLPNGLTNDEILNGRSEIRNRVIARVFKELGYIEQWGSGISRMKSLCLMEKLREPLIEETGSFVGVRFYRKVTLVTNGKSENSKNHFPTDSDRFLPIPTDSDQFRPIPTDSDQLSIEETLTEYLKKHETLTKRCFKKLFNLKDTKAKEILKELVMKGVLLRNGAGRGIQYTLNDKTDKEDYYD